MAQFGFRQLIKRLCFTSVEMDAPEGTSKSDIIKAALQDVLVNGEKMKWITPPVGPKTILPYLEPKQIPASTLTGQEALTTEPEVADVVIPPDGLEVPDEVAAQIAGGVEGAELAEEGEEGDDEEDMAELLVRYLDLEDLLDTKRTKGEPITQEELDGAREMRADLRAAYAGVEEEFDGEEIVELAPDKDVEEVQG
jgi:hypothetical protein